MAIRKPKMEEIANKNDIIKDLSDLVNANCAILNNKLDAINDHLARLNGKVAEHEEKIIETLIERARNREAQINFKKIMEETVDDYEPRLQKLEEEYISKKSLIKFWITSISLFSAIVGIIFVLYKIFFEKMIG